MKIQSNDIDFIEILEDRDGSFITTSICIYLKNGEVISYEKEEVL